MTPTNIICTAVVVVVAWSAWADTSLTMGEQLYCEMVGIHHDSNGENGWPDFNGNYKEVCHGQ